MTANAAPLLEGRTVTRRFGDFTAVHEVSLTVGPGEIVGLVGANGAGKTTLIRMLLGLLEPSEGMVAMFGGLPTRKARRRLGYVPQGLGLYRDMTVAENVQFNAAAYGKDADAITLSDELTRLEDELVGAIGLGRQRQLAFACALGHAPDLVVADEPTSGVDPLSRARLWDAIREQAARGVGVLVTTHYMEEASQCDRLVLMAAGVIAAQGTMGDIIGGRTVVEVTSDSWAQAFAVLSDAGFEPMLAGREVRVGRASAAEVEEALTAAAVDAALASVPATLDETMVAVADAGPGG